MLSHSHMSVDRRRTPRIRCDLLVEWRRSPRIIECRARDLNVSGLFIRTEVPAALHYVMELVVHLPSGPLEVLGVARFIGNSCHGHGIGVEVHSIIDHARARWLAFYRAGLAADAGAQPEPRRC